MGLRVSDPEFWKERLKETAKYGDVHHAVYVSRQALWQEIEIAHKEILSRECAGYDTLDAGCGYGRAAEWFPREKYIGVDISPDLLRIANERYPKHVFIETDLRELPFEDRAFDVAFCISIKQMIVGNLGDKVWLAVENELKRVADRVLILEYEEPDTYWIL
jgi:ubiquinone/menaquinone biosynthesis C-methylase UbiE